MINVAVLGYGTIGSGVVQVIDDNNELISKKLGDDIQVKYILDLRDFPGDKNEAKVVHDFDIILNDPEINIVCEAMGGDNPAYKFSKQALESGKCVCTSNKEVVANHGPELLQVAKANGVNYLFEAAVGGGIPIIRPMNTCLAQEHLDKIMGILNGTTNYMLTKMANTGASYDDVLKEAQDLGYAEKNPTADVEGFDAGRKIAILSSLMTGKNVKFEDVHIEGITKITSRDFEYAKKLGKSIKLIARADNKADGLTVIVAPFMLGADHALCGVNDVFNAVFVTGNMLDDAMFYGRGAGKLPTASAVVADVIECARNLHNTLPCVWDDETLTLNDYKLMERSFFVRVASDSKAAAEKAFGNVEMVSICDEEAAFFAPKMSEKDFEAKLATVPSVIATIRVED